MSNFAENGGVDPRVALKTNPAGVKPLTDQSQTEDLNGQAGLPVEQDILALFEDGINPADPSQNGNLYAIPDQSSIIENMSDIGEYTGQVVAPDTLPNPDSEVITRLQGDFAAIAETGLGPDMNETHGVLLESIYSPQLVPVLKSLLDATNASGDIDGNNEVRAAIQAADAALNDVRALSQDRKRNLYQSFLIADNSRVLPFRNNLRAALEQAITCIEKYRNSISDPQSIHQASEVYDRYIEREKGIKLPSSFVERLFDPNIKVLAIQLDFNSTFNVKETNANPALNVDAQLAIASLVQTFKDKFPDKQISLAINTGRPGQYAWAVHEASIEPIPEIRQFAFAEFGGVIVTNLESGAQEVAVENPHQWQRELQGIRAYITSQLGNPNDLMIERKESMLSIKVAEKNSPDFILKTKEGQPVTPEWIAQQVEDYFLITQSELGAEFEALMLDLEKRFPETHRYIVEHLNGNGHDIPLNQSQAQQPDSAANGNGDLRSKRSQVLKTLRTVFGIAKTELRGRIDAIDARLDTIDIMHVQGLLQAKYNPTAGYVDVAHAHLNKYSTSVKYMGKLLGVKPDEILWSIIGDSTTDIIPDELTGEGEPNEGADTAYMFAVSNKNSKMEAAVLQRGEYARALKNHSANAVRALMVGIEKAIYPSPTDNK